MQKKASEARVMANYQQEGLLDAIRDALHAIGRTPDDVDLHVLGAVDEFHVGGRPATEKLVRQLQPSPAHRILDIGCSWRRSFAC